MLWLDAYERRARLAPGLLALLPVAFTILGLGLENAPVVSSVGGLVTAAGGPVLLASTVRVLGLRVQDRLYAEWRGAPSTQLLRLSDMSVGEAQKTRWRRRVSELTGLTLPTADEERSEPLETDKTYDAAIAVVRELTRDRQRYNMVFVENRSYGFERNLLGLRSMALSIASICAVINVGVLLVQLIWYSVTPGVVAATGLTAVWLIGWTLVPTPNRVRVAAEKYAIQLLNSATA